MVCRWKAICSNCTVAAKIARIWALRRMMARKTRLGSFGSMSRAANYVHVLCGDSDGCFPGNGGECSPERQTEASQSSWRSHAEVHLSRGKSDRCRDRGAS